MGSISYTLKPGETLEDFVRRDNPRTTFAAIERVGSYVFTLAYADRYDAIADYYEPELDGRYLWIGVAKFEGGYVKYMEELQGPYTYAARCPAALLKRASSFKPGPKHYGAAFRQRQMEA